MVAVLLRLRFRVLANTLRRNKLQFVAVLFEVVQAVGLLAAAIGGMYIASGAPAAATQDVVVGGGAAVVLGWIVVPLLFSGVEQTLDPLKLARFPVRTGQLMTAMLLVGIAWIPGVATIAASVLTVVAWHHYPLPALLAVITGIVGALICIAGSRLTTSVVAALVRGRGASRMIVAALATLVVIGPFAASTLGGVAAGDGGTDLLGNFQAGIDVLGWTPLGAVWSIPGRVAMGDVSGAWGAGGIALATVVGVFVAWRIALGRSLRIRSGGRTKVVVGGRLGALGWVPRGVTGAIAARSLIYWFRDARLARQLVLIPILPALMLLLWGLDHIDAFAIAAGPIAASLLPLSVFAGLSYDGTSFAAELAAGVRGVQDRLGRAIALVIIAAPAVIVVQVIVAIIIGRVDELPELLGLALGTLLVSTGVVSVSSARIVVPVARSRRNPFSAPAGAATTSIVGSYAVMGATIVLAIPVIVLTIVAIVTGSTVLGWIALAVGLIVGFGAAVGGVILGGRWLDQSGPSVLARLRLIRA